MTGRWNDDDDGRILHFSGKCYIGGEGGGVFPLFPEISIGPVQLYDLFPLLSERGGNFNFPLFFLPRWHLGGEGRVNSF